MRIKKCIICSEECFGIKCQKCYLSNQKNNKGWFKKGIPSWSKNIKGDDFKLHYKNWDKHIEKIRKINIGRITSKETKEKLRIIHTGRKITWGDKISKTVSNLYKNNPEKRFFLKNYRINNPGCAKKQSLSLKEFYKNNPKKHPNYIMGQKGFVSKPQKELFKIIKLWYNEAILEYPLRLKNSNVYGDIVVHKEKLWVEYDGEYWHKDKEKDMKRQKQIEEKGFNVMRINKTQLNNLKENINIPLWRL